MLRGDDVCHQTHSPLAPLGDPCFLQALSHLPCACLSSLPQLLSQLPHDLLPPSLHAAAAAAAEPLHDVLWRLFARARARARRQQAAGGGATASLAGSIGGGGRGGSDAARLLLLYLYGGVYMDADVGWLGCRCGLVGMWLPADVRA